MEFLPAFFAIMIFPVLVDQIQKLKTMPDAKDRS